MSLAIKHLDAANCLNSNWEYGTETRCKLPKGGTWMVGFKDCFIWFKEWYCCFGKYPAKRAYPFNLPKEAAWLTLQPGSLESVVRLCSWVPITATVTVQGSLRLLLPCKTGVQGLGKNSRIWAEYDCAAPWVPMPRVGGPGKTTWLRDTAKFTLCSQKWQSPH